MQEMLGPLTDRLEAPANGRPAELPPARPLTAVPEPPPAVPAAEPAPARRLATLDAFRGLAILGMLLVNNMALDEHTPRQLVHAEWTGGITFADLVFPWFLFIVGVAIPFSVAAARRRGVSGLAYDLRVLGRAVTLVLLGCLINSSEQRRPVFQLDVLQLIGLSYLVSALAYDLSARRRLFLSGVLLVGHWLFLRYMPIPTIGAGQFTEQHNILQHINEAYLAAYNLQGLWSVIPTAGLVLLGTVVGDALRDNRVANDRRLAVLLIGGLAALGVGLLWGRILPFNKPMWTSSYLLVAAGLALLIMGLMYLVVDLNGGAWLAFPLIVPGRNAIVAYTLPILLKLYILGQWQWKMPDGSNLPLILAYQHTLFVRYGRVPGGWLYTATYLGVCWLILLWLYRKRIYLRV